MTNELSPLLTVQEAAEITRAAPSTIYRWAETGQLPSIKVGRLLRFRREDLVRWIDDLSTPTT